MKNSRWQFAFIIIRSVLPEGDVDGEKGRYVETVSLRLLIKEAVLSSESLLSAFATWLISVPFNKMSLGCRSLYCERVPGLAWSSDGSVFAADGTGRGGFNTCWYTGVPCYTKNVIYMKMAPSTHIHYNITLKRRSLSRFYNLAPYSWFIFRTMYNNSINRNRGNLVFICAHFGAVIYKTLNRLFCAILRGQCKFWW